MTSDRQRFIINQQEERSAGLQGNNPAPFPEVKPTRMKAERVSNKASGLLPHKPAWHCNDCLCVPCPFKMFFPINV